MEDPQRSLSMTPWLVYGILLIAVAAIVIAFVPIVDCPYAHIDYHVKGTWTTPQIAREVAIYIHTHDGCQFCKGTCTITLLTMWTNRTAEQAQ